MTIAVAGTGYVGLSIATLLAQHHKVLAVDIIPQKVEMINRRQSPIQDEYIEKYFAEKQLDLTATLDAEMAYKEAEIVVIAAPTNYDSQRNYFDTSAVESVIQLVLQVNPAAIMVIKSTIPVGYTESVRKKFGTENILFSPEFLRESKALYDNLYPSRIIVGTDMSNPRLTEAAKQFAGLLQEGAIKQDVETLFMATEANYSYLSSSIVKEVAALGVESATETLPYKVGDKVRVTDGPLAAHISSAVVEEISADFKKVKVLGYHGYASGKYAALEIPDTLPAVTVTAEDIEKPVSILRSYGLNAINGMVQD